MAALRGDETWRRSNYKDINDARRRGRGRLSFLQASRATNVAAYVRPQAPVPVSSIIPPPSAASQVNQWDRYVPKARNEPLPLDPALISGPITSRDQLPVILERAELSATGSSVRHELPVSRHAVQRPTSRSTQEPANIALGSPVSPLSNVSTSISWRAPSSAESSSATHYRPVSTALADRRSDAQKGGSIEPQHQLHEGFDCPLRAGPDGSKRCGWKPPRHDVTGFPTMARVREHVGNHGLLCPDCDKVYTIPTRYRDHRQNKAETGSCSALGAERTKFPHLLELPPEIILNFFKRPNRKIPDEEAWYDGYKTLHPHWKKQGSLPLPFYLQNVERANGRISHDVSRSSQDPLEGPSNPVAAVSMRSPPSTSHAIANDNDDQASRESNDEPNYLGIDHPTPASYNISGNILDTIQGMDGLEWYSAFNNETPGFDPSFSNFEMSGALPNDNDTGNFRHEVNASPRDLARQESNELGSCDANMDYYNNAGTSELSSHYLYPFAVNGPPDAVDSAMELYKLRSGSGNETGEVSTTSSVPSAKAQGKRPVRVSAQTPAAKKKVFQRMEKLTEEVVQLYNKIQTLNMENRSLNNKVNEVENEKQKLFVTLMQIRQEVFKWEINEDEALELNERMDTLNESMQNIRQLLSDERAGQSI